MHFIHGLLTKFALYKRYSVKICVLSMAPLDKVQSFFRFLFASLLWLLDQNMHFSLAVWQNSLFRLLHFDEITYNFLFSCNSLSKLPFLPWFVSFLPQFFNKISFSSQFLHKICIFVFCKKLAKIYSDSLLKFMIFFMPEISYWLLLPTFFLIFQNRMFWILEISIQNHPWLEKIIFFFTFILSFSHIKLESLIGMFGKYLCLLDCWHNLQ